MMVKWLIIFLLFWLACGVMAYGLIFSYFQDNWKQFAWKYRNTDRLIAVAYLMLGPIGAIASYCLYDRGKPRLRFRSITAEESRDRYKLLYPLLTHRDWLQ